MTKNQRLKTLQGLDRPARRSLSETESCKAEGLTTAHERLMWCAGFRKGIAQALRGDRTRTRAAERSARGRHGDKSWATGFNAGVNYVPADVSKKKRRS